MDRTNWFDHSIALFIFIIMAAGPLWRLYPTFGITILCLCIAAMGYHLLLGYMELASLGHAAFYGVAAYINGYLAKNTQLDAVWLIVIAIFTGGVLGALMGYVAIKRKGIYFTMITLAVAQIIYFICVQLPFTGGEDGMQGIPRPNLLGTISLQNDWTMYYLCLSLTIVIYYAVSRIINSPFGLNIKGIEANDDKMKSIGCNTKYHIWLLFILSAIICSIAGTLKAMGLKIVTLNDVHWMLSGTILVMALVGGNGRLSGPLIGAIIITTLETKVGVLSNWIAQYNSLEWINRLTNSSTFVIGLVFILFVLVFPSGILGFASKILKKN